MNLEELLNIAENAVNSRDQDDLVAHDLTFSPTLILKLLEELKDAREMAEFYGNEKNWDGCELRPWDSEEAQSNAEYGYEDDAEKHSGKRAREFLAKYKEM